MLSAQTDSVSDSASPLTVLWSKIKNESYGGCNCFRRQRHTLSAVCNSLSSAFCPFSCVSLAALFERNRAGQRVSKETENVFEFSTEMFCVFSWCCRRSLFVWRSPTAAKRPILLPVDPVLFHWDESNLVTSDHMKTQYIEITGRWAKGQVLTDLL